MARYIDADELYKATQKRIAEANEARMAVVDDEFLDLINDAFTEDVAPRAEWISVEERLPDEKQKVLLYSPADGIQIGHRLDEVGRFYVSKAYPERPTHWMPLPSAPKKEKNND